MTKLRFLGLFIILMAFVFTACDSDSGSDSWQSLGSWAEMNGTWEGTASQNYTIRDYLETYGEEEWTHWHHELYGNMSVRFTVVENITINSNTMRLTGTQRQTRAFSGGNTAALWPEIKNLFIELGHNVNDSNNSASIIFILSGALPDYIPPDWQINRNGNRVRTPSTVGNYMVYTRQ